MLFCVAEEKLRVYCGKDMSEWICCEEKGCRKVTWVDNDTVIKRLDSG